jgi:membrane carboxypeptidase/penicillin-binding protein
MLEPGTGEVRALVGGRHPEVGGFNRATQARRQPGSAIKPIVYAAAIDPKRGGTKLTAASVVPDLPRTFAVEDTTWRPDNSDGTYHPQITLGKALARSENVATSNVVEEIGPQTVARYAQAFGLGKLKPVMSIGLGSNEVTLLDLTSAYAVFPDGGVRHAPRPVRAVVDALGKNVLAPPARPTRVLDAPVASVLVGMLQNVVIYGIAYPLRKTYGFTRPSAGKTGTTNGYRDAWYMGFTPELVAGVWVGYDTPKSLNRIAAEVAIPVWAQVVGPLVEGTPPTPFPENDDVEWVWMDGWTGGRARGDCPSTMNMPFLKGTAPKEVCRADHTEDWARIFLERLGQDSLRVMLGIPGDSTLAPAAPQ